MFFIPLLRRIVMPRAAAAAGLLLLGACAGGGNGADPAELQHEIAFQRQLALEEQVTMQRRIDAVSFGVMSAGADFCGDRQRAAHGFTVANRHSFGAAMTEAAGTLFGLDDSVRILSVIPGTPAAQAGLVEGDVITRVNGQPVLPGRESVAVVRSAMTAADRQGLRLNLGGANPRQVSLQPVIACDFPVEVMNSDKVNAYADGQRIRVTKGMLWFAHDDAELAMVMAHELAHNVMGHAGTFGSMFQDSKSREADADYVGLYIMARGGFEIEKAAGFWRRMAAAFPQLIESSSSHPLMPARFVALRQTTAEIRDLQARGLALVPRSRERLALSLMSPSLPPGS